MFCFLPAFQEPLSVNATAAGGLNTFPGRWGHVRAISWRSTKLYAQVKLGLFHMAFEMLVSYATKPALKADSFCFSLLSLVAHWLLSNLSCFVMGQGSKALPSSIRGLAHLMRLVLVGKEGLCWCFGVGVRGELSICLLPLCLPDDCWDPAWLCRTHCSLLQCRPLEGLGVAACSFIQTP